MQSEAVNQWLDAAHVRSMAEGLLVPGPQGSGFANEKMFGSSFVGYAGPTEAIAPSAEIAEQSLSGAQSHVSSSGIPQEKEISPHAATSLKEPVQNAPETAIQEPAEAVIPSPVGSTPVEDVDSTRVEQSVQVKPEPTPIARSAKIASPFKIASEVKKPEPPVPERFRPLPLSTRLQAFGTWLMEQIPTRSYFICDRHGEIVVDEVGSDKLVKVARTLAHASSSAGKQVGDEENLGSLHVKIGPDRVMEVVPRHSHFGLVVLGLIVQRPLSRDAVSSVSRALGTALAEPSAPRE